MKTKTKTRTIQVTRKELIRLNRFFGLPVPSRWQLLKEWWRERTAKNA